MNKLKVFKTATRIAVGFGTTTITRSIIQNNVSPSNPVEAVSVVLAAVVVGSMASEATKSHTDAKIDEFVSAWNNSKPNQESPVTA